MPMGPFQMADLAGVDIGWHRDPNRIENIRDALCAVDRWGQKKGAGFYDYDEKRRPSESATVQQIIEDFRAKAGVQPREISDQEIMERTIYTMVNEGALILEGGFAQRASDIDVVWIYGYGWPVYRGGRCSGPTPKGCRRSSRASSASRKGLGRVPTIRDVGRQSRSRREAQQSLTTKRESSRESPPPACSESRKIHEGRERRLHMHDDLIAGDQHPVRIA
jgi:hypothetical protein